MFVRASREPLLLSGLKIQAGFRRGPNLWFPPVHDLAKPTAAGNPVRITFGRLFLQEIYRRAVLPRHAIQELRFTPASNPASASLARDLIEISPNLAQPKFRSGGKPRPRLIMGAFFTYFR